MTLGEKIAKLRTMRNMSQSDFAEQIKVSRQSVSKWETDASIPELDKLIQISNFFGITLDELVKEYHVENEKSHAETEIHLHSKTKEPADSKTASFEHARIHSTQRTIGFILLAVGLFGLLIGFLTLNILIIIITAYMILCGILCLIVKRRVGIFIGWITFLPLAFLMRFVTASSMHAVFIPYFYFHAESFSPFILVFSYLMWVFFITLFFLTLQKTRLQKYRFLLLGWIILYYTRGSLFGFFPALFHFERTVSDPLLTASFIIGLIAFILLLILLFFTVKAILPSICKLRQK